MKTSCIAHPPKEPLIIIRQWQVKFCKGDKCAAALMSFLEYWHNIKLEQSVKSKQANNTAEIHGDNRIHDESLVQFHTSEQLSDGIMGLYSETKIRKSLRFLEEQGVINVFKNPNRRYAFDKTKHFIFHPEECNKYIQKVYKANDTAELSDVAKLPHRSDENTERYGKNTDGYIKSTDGEAPRKPAPAVAPTLVEKGPEITTETTTKNKELINENSFKQKKDIQQHPIVNSSLDNSQTEDTGENVDSTSEEPPSNPSETQDNHEDLNGGPATIAPAAHSFLTMITQFQNAMKKGVKQATLNGMLIELLEKLGVEVKKKNGDYNYSVAGKGWKLKKGQIIDTLYLMHQKKTSGELNSPTGYWHKVLGE